MNESVSYEADHYGIATPDRISAGDIYRWFFLDSSDAMFITDTDGNILRHNSAANEMFGIPPERFRELKAYDLYSIPQDRIMFLKLLERDGKVNKLERALKRGNGSSFIGELSSHLRIASDGKSTIESIIRDITEERMMERELALEKARLDSLVENAPLAIAIANVDGSIIRVNHRFERLFGWNRTEIIGRCIDDLVTPSECRTTATDITRVAASGEVRIEEAVRYHKDGGPVEVAIMASPILIEDEKVGIYAIYEDIAPRKKGERSILQLNEVLRLMNKSFRHDLGNDLNIAMNAIELFRYKQDSKLLDAAVLALGRSGSLINRMKELDTLTSASKNLRRMEISELLKEIQKRFPISIDVQGTGMVLVDDSIHSVIENLIRNAIVHGGTDRITIRIEGKGDLCDVRVIDYGKGIPAEIKGQLFKEGASFGSSRGTGMGLYIVRMVVEMYGGSVRIEDNVPSGTVFVLTLRTH
jgi:PAS domain S-box-containing protein